MDDKNKVKMLEQQLKVKDRVIADLQKILMERDKPRPCYLKKIANEVAEEGFDYPMNCLNIWVDYRDGSVMMILPKKEEKK